MIQLFLMVQKYAFQTIQQLNIQTIQQ